MNLYKYLFNCTFYKNREEKIVEKICHLKVFNENITK